jgi:hypothetical protein
MAWVNPPETKAMAIAGIEAKIGPKSGIHGETY